MPGTVATSAGAHSRAAPEITCLWPGPTKLGESPLWDHRTGRLYWIDSLGPTIWHMVWETGATGCWQMPDIIGSIGLRRGGGLVAALRDQFGFVDGDTGVFEPGIAPVGVAEGTRLNDGKVDRAGRFWCGAMDPGFSSPSATLFRINADLSCRPVDQGFMVSNGIAFSPDDTRFYFSDSRPDRSYVYDFDIRAGTLGNRRAFSDPSSYAGRIDGATVDTDGNYWGALFDGGAIGCFSPEGRLIRRVDMPVSCPTMCSFGGPELDQLFVTSAYFSLSEADRAREPQAGGLFRINGLGAKAPPEPEFGG